MGRPPADLMLMWTFSTFTAYIQRLTLLAHMSELTSCGPVFIAVHSCRLNLSSQIGGLCRTGGALHIASNLGASCK